ncbi:uncharacterized protein L203_103213 [Cryptococcus depauperatus CBS 7841]|uniref:Uncharacterized protein n=1 Tax=Cryptococcus depauperatus CBS 7841 TaxID=1295531 RepID=A0A1E3HPG8_9TREE|nr:hypothetical protein L203_06170 [Cryptococcus depauperatus CBS 7841]
MSNQTPSRKIIQESSQLASSLEHSLPPSFDESSRILKSLNATTVQSLLHLKEDECKDSEQFKDALEKAGNSLNHLELTVAISTIDSKESQNAWDLALTSLEELHLTTVIVNGMVSDVLADVQWPAIMLKIYSHAREMLLSAAMIKHEQVLALTLVECCANVADELVKTIQDCSGNVPKKLVDNMERLEVQLDTFQKLLAVTSKQSKFQQRMLSIKVRKSINKALEDLSVFVIGFGLRNDNLSVPILFKNLMAYNRTAIQAPPSVDAEDVSSENSDLQENESSSNLKSATSKLIAGNQTLGPSSPPQSVVIIPPPGDPPEYQPLPVGQLPSSVPSSPDPALGLTQTHEALEAAEKAVGKLEKAATIAGVITAGLTIAGNWLPGVEGVCTVVNQMFESAVSISAGKVSALRLVERCAMVSEGVVQAIHESNGEVSEVMQNNINRLTSQLQRHQQLLAKVANLSYYQLLRRSGKTESEILQATEDLEDLVRVFNLQGQILTSAWQEESRNTWRTDIDTLIDVIFQMQEEMQKKNDAIYAFLSSIVFNMADNYSPFSDFNQSLTGLASSSPPVIPGGFPSNALMLHQPQQTEENKSQGLEHTTGLEIPPLIQRQSSQALGSSQTRKSQAPQVEGVQLAASMMRRALNIIESAHEVERKLQRSSTL